MAEKISCGGFYIDDETLTIEDGVLKVSSGGSFLITADVENPWNSPTPQVIRVDKNYEEILEAFRNNLIPTIIFDYFPNDNEAHMICLPFYGVSSDEHGETTINFALVDSSTSGVIIRHLIKIDSTTAYYSSQVLYEPSSNDSEISV